VQIKDLMNKISTEVEWREDPERLSQALRTMMRLGEDTLLA
jgi:hypothetical protein